MAERYDTAAASHYAAYRPPLHTHILERALGKNARFALGVDVGCGTGRSTIALALYCRQTVGIDPSASMLGKAEPHKSVSYRVGAGDSIPIADATADIVTFAGSLHYADSAATRSEVQRVGRTGATVLVYDFDVQLAPILRRLGIILPSSNSDYNHAANFSGRDGFVERDVRRETTTLEMSATEFAHVALSDSNRLDYLTGLFGPDSIHDSLVRATQAGAPDAPAGVVRVTAALYFSLYILE